VAAYEVSFSVVSLAELLITLMYLMSLVYLSSLQRKCWLCNKCWSSLEFISVWSTCHISMMRLGAY